MFAGEVERWEYDVYDGMICGDWSTGAVYYLDHIARGGNRDDEFIGEKLAGSIYIDGML
jgi:hypothetical protein